MNAQIIPYMLLLLFATVISFILATYSFLKRSIPAARFFGILALGIGIWSLFYLFEVVNLILRLKELFFALKYIGVVMVPVGLLAFAMEYTGISLQRILKWLPILTLEPVVTLALLATNDLHGLFYTNARLEIGQGFIVMAFTPEVMFIVNTVYSLIIGIIAIGLMIQYYFKSAGFRRRQILFFIAGGIAPIVVLTLILSGVTPLPSLDFTSVAMVTSLPFLAVSVFQYRLLDVVPEARDLAIEFMDDSVIVINRRFHILDLNPAAQSLFHVKAIEVIGHELNELIPLTQELKAGISQPERFQQDLNLQSAGQEVQFELRSFRLESWYGRPAGRLVLLHDVTETRQLEQNLRQAKDAAEEATRAKSLFLASMSHEIRTPLNAVIGMTSLLQDTPLTVEQQEYVNTIRAGSDTLLTSINDILDFSKIEAGRMEMETQPFALHRCIEDAINILAQQAAGKDLEMFFMPAADLPDWVIGDPTRLRQVLVNLISNAVKFTDQGEIVVRAEVDHTEGVKISLHISIEDTGIGIPEQSLDRVFEVFTQADPSISRRYGGTGLGLSIANRLVHIMGGRLWAESEEGQGSIFHFTIIVEKAASVAEPFTDNQRDLLIGKNVLVVDDSATNRKILVNHLRAWGMTAHEVTSAQQALTWLQTARTLDLILMDMNLPDMNGADLARTVGQENPLRPPIVLLSSLAQRPNDADRSLFAAILNKPIRPAQLHDLMIQIFNRENGREVSFEKVATSLFDTDFAESHPLRILLAEDNPVNQRVATGFLERLGYQIDTVANGLEAVEAVRRQPYDLVLMDVRMPEVDGLQAARQIRALPAPIPQPRIVAMTAYAYQEDLAECLAAGMDDFIPKPIQYDRMVSVIGKINALPGTVPAEEYRMAPQPASILDTLGEGREEILALLLKNLNEKGTAFQTAWVSGDVDLVREYAHQLKTDASYLGAHPLAQLFLAVERRAISGDLPEPAVYDEIISLMAQVSATYSH